MRRKWRIAKLAWKYILSDSQAERTALINELAKDE